MLMSQILGIGLRIRIMVRMLNILRVSVLQLVEQMLSSSFILIQSDRFGFGVSERGWF